MTIRTFSIEVSDDLGPMWMNRDTLLACLCAYCQGVRFNVADVTGDGCDPQPITAVNEGGSPNHPLLVSFAEEVIHIIKRTQTEIRLEDMDRSASYEEILFLARNLGLLEKGFRETSWPQGHER